MIASIVLPILIVGAALAAVVVFAAGVRIFAPQFVDYHGMVVVAEAPITAIDRVQRAVARQARYTYRRVGTSKLEVVHASVAPDDDAQSELPRLAPAFADVLVATAEPGATGTEVTLEGRAEPRVINAIRVELGHARVPRFQRRRG